MIQKNQLERRTVYLLLVCAVLFLAIGFLPSIVGSDSRDELEVTLCGLRLAADSIRSGAGKVLVHNISTRKDDGVVETETEYDVKIDFANATFKYLGKTTYIRNDSPTAGPFASGSTFTREGSYNGNQAMRFDHESKNATVFKEPDGPQQAAYNENFLRPCSLVLDFDLNSVQEMKNDGLRVARREVLDGKDCIVLEVSKVFPAASEQTPLTISQSYWVSIEEGYAVRRSETYFAGGNWGDRFLKTRRSLEVRKLSSDHWVPTRYHYVEYSRNGSSSQAQILLAKTVTFDADFQFNVPVVASELQINLPPGTHVNDSLLEADYTVP